MTEENKTVSNLSYLWKNKTFIIVAAVVALVIIVLYIRDQQQQEIYQLQNLERRVQMLEEGENTHIAAPAAGVGIGGGRNM